MTEPTLELQRAIGERLATTPAVTDLVAATSIMDGTARPENYPAITFGDGQTVQENVTFGRNHARAYVDLNVWTPTGENVLARMIAGAIREALRAPLALRDLHVLDFDVAGARFLRDPSGAGRAIVSIEALISYGPSPKQPDDCADILNSVPDLVGIYEEALR